MRNITHIIVHCTATAQTATVAAIQNYWRNTLGWVNPGYHVLIEANGNTRQLHDYSLTANGAAGHNANSIHIAYIGGVNQQGQPADNRTPQQKAALLRVITELKNRFPNAIICGHRDLPGVTKACPAFDAKTEYQSV